MSELTQVLLENYGPIGLLALFLWRRQRAMIGAILTLAEEQPEVDEDRLKERLRRF